MDITITATEANRKFSAMLRGVRQGKRYVITSRGEPVAELAAAAAMSPAEIARKRRAWKTLLKRLESQKPLNLPHISRDEMYE